MATSKEEAMLKAADLTAKPNAVIQGFNVLSPEKSLALDQVFGLSTSHYSEETFEPLSTHQSRRWPRAVRVPASG